MVVDENTVHLEIRLFSRFPLVKLNESILQRITRLLVLDDFTAEDLAESTENEFEVLGARNGVQLADKEDILRWTNLSKG